MIIVYVYVDKFMVVGMGESFFVNFGLKYKCVVNIGLIIVLFIVLFVILIVGMLLFFGLIILNMVLIYKGDNLRSSLFYIVLLGVVFVLFCDILGRVIIFLYEIFIGLMVGVIGSGIFLYMLLRRKVYEL